MCGRYILAATAEELGAYFDEPFDLEWGPSFNIAPGRMLPVLRLANNRKQWLLAKWGLVPSWAKEDRFAFKTINARIETVLEKPAYRSSIKKQRCLVPANGFYEWQEVRGKKQPHFVHRAKNQLFAFAGIWDERISDDGEVLTSFSILTQPAQEEFYDLHDRFPVIMPKKSHDSWLEHGNELVAAHKNFSQLAGFSHHPVTQDVNRATFNGPECIKRIVRAAG